MNKYSVSHFQSEILVMIHARLLTCVLDTIDVYRCHFLYILSCSILLFVRLHKLVKFTCMCRRLSITLSNTYAIVYFFSFILYFVSVNRHLLGNPNQILTKFNFRFIFFFLLCLLFKVCFYDYDV